MITFQHILLSLSRQFICLICSYDEFDIAIIIIRRFIDILFKFTFNGREEATSPSYAEPKRKVPWCVRITRPDGVFIVVSYYYNAAEKRCLMKMMMGLIRGLVQHSTIRIPLPVIIIIADEDEWMRCCNDLAADATDRWLVQD